MYKRSNSCGKERFSKKVNTPRETAAACRGEFAIGEGLLDENVGDDFAGNIREPEVAALIAVRQAFVVDAQ